MSNVKRRLPLPSPEEQVAVAKEVLQQSRRLPGYETVGQEAGKVAVGLLARAYRVANQALIKMGIAKGDNPEALKRLAEALLADPEARVALLAQAKQPGRVLGRGLAGATSGAGAQTVLAKDEPTLDELVQQYLSRRGAP